MNILNNSQLTILLTLATYFLALSIVVQVVQELYKYLRSSKGRAYRKALQDFLGPMCSQIFSTGVLTNLRVRGPMQLRRVSPKGQILPLNKEDLSKAMERTAPPWIQRTLNELKLEVSYKSGKQLDMSASWSSFLNEIGKVEHGTSGYWSGYEIAEFLNSWGHEWKKTNSKIIGELKAIDTNLNANELLMNFKKKFLPHLDEALDNYTQFESNFEYTYTRANRRQTFIISLLLAFIFCLPINVLYQNAQKIDSAAAIKLAESTIEIYEDQVLNTDTLNSEIQISDSLIKSNLKLINQIMTEKLNTNSNQSGITYFTDWSSFVDIFEGDFRLIKYLFYCLITSIFLTFGAPFWNDIASALLRIQKGSTAKKSSSSREVRNG
jgi:hypothetical protein